MIKRICDICNKNESTDRFKIKRLKDVTEITEHGIYPKKVWVDIDVCKSCLIDISKGKSKEKKDD